MMLIKTIYKTPYEIVIDKEDTFFHLIKLILTNYNHNVISGFQVQYSLEEDWTPINIYDLLDELIPEDRHFHRWGIYIYKFDNFYIIANPDHDIVEIFND